MRRVLLPVQINARALVTGHIETLCGETMGTRWCVKCVLNDASSSPALQAQLQAVLDRIVMQMSTWDSRSDLSRYNQSAAATWCAMPRELLQVLHAARALAADTNGAYDPTAGALVDLWGFGPAPKRSEPPTADEVANALRTVGWQKLQLSETSALQAGGVQLDLSSIAKGYAVDALVNTLAASGIDNALVEVGGELCGVGLKHDGQPWWVTLETPQGPGLLLPDIVAGLHGLAVATSGDSQQGFTHAGQHYSHTLDPRSGWPVSHGLASVSVLHTQTMQADAIATALMVLGLEAGMAYAQQGEIAARFVQRSRTGLQEHLSPAMQRMLG